MIKAVVQIGGEPIVIFGLSGENVARLVAGEVVRIKGSEVRLPGYTFAIMYGRTEDDIKMEISKALVEFNEEVRNGRSNSHPSDKQSG